MDITGLKTPGSISATGEAVARYEDATMAAYRNVPRPASSSFCEQDTAVRV
jgi:hypothetical protein